MHIMIAFVSSILVLILMQGNHHGTVSAFTFTTAPTTTTTTATTSTSTRKRFSFAVGVHSKEFGRKQAAAPDPTSRITRTNTEHNLPYAYGQSSSRTPSPTTIDERNPRVVQKERDQAQAQAQAQYQPQTSVPPNPPSTNTNADININNNKNINDVKNMKNNLKNSIKNSMNNSMNNNRMNNNSMNNNSMNNNNIDTNIQSKTERVAEAKRVVLSFISALYDEPKGFSGKMDMSTKNNDNKVQTEYNIMDYFQETVEVTDTSYHKSIIGKHALIQHLQQRPKSVFYINNELPSMQVLSVTVGSSAGQIGGTTDVKVAVLYQYWTNGEEDDKGKGKGKGKVPNDEGSDAEVGEDWDKQSGITFYTVSDGLISNVFDVKEGSKLDTSKLKAEKFDPKKVANLQMVKETSEDLKLNLNPYANLPMAFLEARNQRNLDDMMDMMADDCWAKGITMDDTLSRGKKVYALRLGQLTEGITFETEEIVASMSSPGDLEVAVRWTMCLEDQQQTYHRGCTYFTVEDGLITSVMDILESSKQDEPPSRPGGFSVSRQNWLRDSGVAADLFDTLQASSFPSILKEHSKSGNGSPEFAKLSLGRKKIKYGKHSSQFVDMFLPPDMDNRRGLVFFVHGGAWGSGKPWMYRLAATPFLEANMAVAIVGYRTYADGNIQDQIDDLEFAAKAIATRYPELSEQPANVDDEDWVGSTMLGHSSGGHIVLMNLVQRIERWTQKPQNEETIYFDNLISISGVYSITEHYDFEASRGVTDISPMKPACGYNRESFNAYSPATRLAELGSYPIIQSDLVPDILLIHGVDDEITPFTSADRARKLLEGTGFDDKLDVFFSKRDHTADLFQLIFGGQTGDLVMDWLGVRQDGKSA